MTTTTTEKKPRWQRLLQAGAMGAALLTGGLAFGPGCLSRPIERVEPRTTTTIVERLTQSSVDKIDLLIVIDNSRSMADKQQILGLAVPDLVNQLVNPACLDPEGGQSAEQPASPLDPCPIAGHEREFDPILDIHIGLLSSSLGGHGADACSANTEPSENDLGRLIFRTVDGGTVSTYQNLGFLAWDPDQQLTPPGEVNAENLVANLSAMVSGAGEVGCGFEAQLESWYRFLVDPDPHATIELQDDLAVPIDTDETLLAMRKDFMRPDSLLAIIMLSDENDCSIRDGSQFYFVAQLSLGGEPYHLPKPQSACSSDPNSSCCRSCGQNAASGCPEKGEECNGAIAQEDDPVDLRCYDQKRRFGIDFLHPIDRYVTGLSSATVQDRHGNIVANPVFTDLDTTDDITNIRDPGLVFLAGIVGVPWQDIARRDGNGNPDLLNGLDLNGNPVGGFQSGEEMAVNNTWDIVLGDPANYVPPQDPLMVESIQPRQGSNPITGEAVGPIGAGTLANSINGHERRNQNRDDLQYACIFDLQETRDCSNPAETACDCDAQQATAEDAGNPLCLESNGTYSRIQRRAKAYPGLRELNAIRDLGDQGIVGSICPAQQTNANGFDFGYRPAIGAIIERLKEALRGQCLPRSLTPNSEGQVACLILEARKSDGTCACTGNGRADVKEANRAAEQAVLNDSLSVAQGVNCVCEITQTVGEDLVACQNETELPVENASGQEVHGWCYVEPPTGNEAIVADCPSTERRIIRFVGEGQGETGATLFITCSGE